MPFFFFAIMGFELRVLHMLADVLPLKPQPQFKRSYFKNMTFKNYSYEEISTKVNGFCTELPTSLNFKEATNALTDWFAEKSKSLIIK
jgi:hypothetical protein